MGAPIESLAGALAALLEVPALTESLRRNVELERRMLRLRLGRT
jgi:hypothetical protein